MDIKKFCVSGKETTLNKIMFKNKVINVARLIYLQE